MSYLVQYFGMRRNKRGKILIGYHEGGNGSNKVKNHCTKRTDIASPISKLVNNYNIYSIHCSGSEANECSD